MQRIHELDIVSWSGVGTPDFDALSERSNYRRYSQSTVAGPPSCVSVALRRRLRRYWHNNLKSFSCILFKFVVHVTKKQFSDKFDND